LAKLVRLKKETEMEVMALAEKSRVVRSGNKTSGKSPSSDSSPPVSASKFNCGYDCKPAKPPPRATLAVRMDVMLSGNSGMETKGRMGGEHPPRLQYMQKAFKVVFVKAQEQLLVVHPSMRHVSAATHVVALTGHDKGDIVRLALGNRNPS
jgi:hypothetical protein